MLPLGKVWLEKNSSRLLEVIEDVRFTCAQVIKAGPSQGHALSRLNNDRRHGGALGCGAVSKGVSALLKVGHQHFLHLLRLELQSASAHGRLTGITATSVCSTHFLDQSSNVGGATRFPASVT